MAKISELVSQRVSRRLADSAILLEMASVLSMSVESVKSLVSAHGAGCIYTKTGFVMHDIPHLRYKLVREFGTCVIITETGDVVVKTPESIGHINRKVHAKEQKRERGKLRNEIARMRERKGREKAFREAQGKSCPKHQGKGNSHEDIGKYAYVPSTIYQPTRAITVFEVINPFK